MNNNNFSYSYSYNSIVHRTQLLYCISCCHRCHWRYLAFFCDVLIYDMVLFSNKLHGSKLWTAYIWRKLAIRICDSRFTYGLCCCGIMCVEMEKMEIYRFRSTVKKSSLDTCRFVHKWRGSRTHSKWNMMVLRSIYTDVLKSVVCLQN